MPRKKLVICNLSLSCGSAFFLFQWPSGDLIHLLPCQEQCIINAKEQNPGGGGKNCLGRSKEILKKKKPVWWRFQIFFNFHPYLVKWSHTPKLGEDSYFDDHIFHLGGFTSTWEYDPFWLIFSKGLVQPPTRKDLPRDRLGRQVAPAVLTEPWTCQQNSEWSTHLFDVMLEGSNWQTCQF